MGNKNPFNVSELSHLCHRLNVCYPLSLAECRKVAQFNAPSHTKPPPSPFPDAYTTNNWFHPLTLGTANFIIHVLRSNERHQHTAKAYQNHGGRLRLTIVLISSSKCREFWWGVGVSGGRLIHQRLSDAWRLTLRGNGIPLNCGDAGGAVERVRFLQTAEESVSTTPRYDKLLLLLRRRCR